jgi:protein phosphatase
MMTLAIPDPCLVLLVGGDAAARKAFADAHFAEDEIVRVTDNADRDAIEARLRSRRLTVVNAPNLTFENRLPWYSIAKAAHSACVAIVIAPANPSLNDANKRAAKSIRKHEGVYALGIVQSPALDDLKIVRKPIQADKRTDCGPFDLIGDPHGCREELEDLLKRLGWSVTWSGSGSNRRPSLTHPEGRKLVILGDMVDRGPYSLDCLLIAESVVVSGVGYAVMGNHDDRLLRWMQGQRVDQKYGFAKTLSEFEGLDKAVLGRLRAFLESLPSHLVFDGGDLVVAHAGLSNGMALGMSARVERFAIFGPMTNNDAGENVRIDWAAEYAGDATVVYGHLSQETAIWRSGTICIDTACVFGGELTALRWPERDLVSVPARMEYHPREHDPDALATHEKSRAP